MDDAEADSDDKRARRIRGPRIELDPRAARRAAELLAARNRGRITVRRGGIGIESLSDLLGDLIAIEYQIQSRPGGLLGPPKEE